MSGRRLCLALSCVLATVDDCAAASVKSVVVITAGFAETGSDGLALQNALVERVREIVTTTRPGPNTT